MVDLSVGHPGKLQHGWVAAGVAGQHAQLVLPSTAFCSSLMDVTIVLVVSMRPAMEAAFCNAQRTTFVGSTMPALNMSTHWPVNASKPSFGLRESASSTMTEPSSPAFWAI